MKRLIFGCAAYVVVLSPAAAQPGATWSILAVAAASPEDLPASDALLSSGLEELLTQEEIELASAPRSILTIELDHAALADEAATIGADAAVVLQFATRGGNAGFAQISVLPVAGSASHFAEFVFVGRLLASEIEKLSAWVIEGLSGCRRVMVELLLYTTPVNTSFTVNGSTPRRTRLRYEGHNSDQGFYNWIGSVPEGDTDVRFYNLPDYHDATRTIRAECDTRRTFPIEVTLEQR